MTCSAEMRVLAAVVFQLVSINSPMTACGINVGRPGAEFSYLIKIVSGIRLRKTSEKS